MIIEINGKKVGTKFNNYAMEQIAAVKGSGSFHFIISVIWGGYLGYCFVKQVEPEITFEEIIDWVDNATDNETISEQVKLIQSEMLASQAYLKLVKKATSDNSEKKSLLSELSGTTSTPTPGGSLD